MRYQSKSLYRVTKEDSRTTCPNGHRIVLLAAYCATRLPSFSICHTCGFVGETGVGIVKHGMKP